MRNYQGDARERERERQGFCLCVRGTSRGRSNGRETEFLVDSRAAFLNSRLAGGPKYNRVYDIPRYIYFLTT